MELASIAKSKAMILIFSENVYFTNKFSKLIKSELVKSSESFAPSPRCCNPLTINKIVLYCKVFYCRAMKNIYLMTLKIGSGSPKS